jgi:hypothetical protein
MSDEYRKDDHGRIVTSGAWFGTLVVSALLSIADLHMPYILGWLLNTTVILGVSYVMARWKRAWYAWLAFWGLAATCLLCAILKAATPWLDGSWSSGTQAMAWLLVGCWYWLLRAPRKHPPKLADVTHIVHHHVLHHPDGRAVEVGQSGPARHGTVPAELDVTAWPAVSQRRQPIALENLASRPGPFPGRLREVIRRRTRPLA